MVKKRLYMKYGQYNEIHENETRKNLEQKKTKDHGSRGHWAVYYTSTQSVKIKFSYLLAYQP